MNSNSKFTKNLHWHIEAQFLYLPFDYDKFKWIFIFERISTFEMELPVPVPFAICHFAHSVTFVHEPKEAKNKKRREKRWNIQKCVLCCYVMIEMKIHRDDCIWNSYNIRIHSRHTHNVLRDQFIWHEISLKDMTKETVCIFPRYSTILLNLVTAPTTDNQRIICIFIFISKSGCGSGSLFHLSIQNHISCFYCSALLMDPTSRDEDTEAEKKEKNKKKKMNEIHFIISFPDT